MKIISSLKNPAVQEARALSSVKDRARQRAFLLDGEHMVGEGLHMCPERVRCGKVLRRFNKRRRMFKWLQ